MKYLKRKARAVRNRVRKFRRSPAYDTFIGVLFALIVWDIGLRLIGG